MKKSGLDVHLVEEEALLEPNRRKLDNRCVRFVVVQSRSLLETLGDDLSFVSHRTPILVVLNAKNHLFSNGFTLAGHGISCHTWSFSIDCSSS